MSKKTQKYHMQDGTFAELIEAGDLSSRAKPLPAPSKEIVQFFITHPVLLDIAAERGEDFVKRFLRQHVYPVSPLRPLPDERRIVTLPKLSPAKECFS
jgi:hypothetical protein